MKRGGQAPGVTQPLRERGGFDEAGAGGGVVLVHHGQVAAAQESERTRPVGVAVMFQQPDRPAAANALFAPGSLASTISTRARDTPRLRLRANRSHTGPHSAADH